MAPDHVFVHETAGARPGDGRLWIKHVRSLSVVAMEVGVKLVEIRPARATAVFIGEALPFGVDSQRLLRRDLNARGRNDSHAGPVGVRFVDLNRKLWTREGKTTLTDRLAVITCEELDLAAAAPVEATA